MLRTTTHADSHCSEAMLVGILAKSSRSWTIRKTWYVLIIQGGDSAQNRSKPRRAAAAIASVGAVEVMGAPIILASYYRNTSEVSTAWSDYPRPHPFRLGGLHKHPRTAHRGRRHTRSGLQPTFSRRSIR